MGLRSAPVLDGPCRQVPGLPSGKGGRAETLWGDLLSWSTLSVPATPQDDLTGSGKGPPELSLEGTMESTLYWT